MMPPVRRVHPQQAARHQIPIFVQLEGGGWWKVETGVGSGGGPHNKPLKRKKTRSLRVFRHPYGPSGARVKQDGRQCRWWKVERTLRNRRGAARPSALPSCS